MLSFVPTKKLCLIYKRPHRKENPDVNLLDPPGVPEASLSLISWPGTHWPKVIRQDQDLLLSSFCLSSVSVWSKVKEIISARAAEWDWVWPSDHRDLVLGGPSLFTLPLSVLEARPEFFCGTRSNSSDRTMDMGLAEDHFSRPMVGAQTANCPITVLHAGLHLLQTCVWSSSRGRS